MRFIPDRRYTVLAGSGALGALAALLLTSDAAGRVLSGLAAVLLLSYVVCDLVFSPRIAASAVGIVINAPLTRARLDWADVHHI
ncbi:MAG TPA: hypothetical protein VKB75_03895, partial [Jatrophihabitans sp.]|nr:hypothetical protein [Jatrophihabitans sp.]